MEETHKIGPEKRSDNCLKLLCDTAKAISSAVSYERYKEIVPTVGNKKKIYDHLQHLIEVNIVTSINYGFEQLQIAKKMENLDELAKDIPNNTVAWRPTTGQIDLSSAEKWGLMLRKLALQKKIETLDKENDILKQRIVDKRETIKQHTEDLQVYATN
ncbi:hypothetical protein Trydic_g2218 [Trypoxylus dichotomus]